MPSATLTRLDPDTVEALTHLANTALWLKVEGRSVDGVYAYADALLDGLTCG